MAEAGAARRRRHDQIGRLPVAPAVQPSPCRLALEEASKAVACCLKIAIAGQRTTLNEQFTIS